MEKLFKDIKKFQDEIFPTGTYLSKAKHLQKEVKELIEALENNHNIFEVDMEYADCFILLIGSALSNGMSYDSVISAIERKMEINRGRKWGKPDKDGVILHLKEE